MTFKFMSSLSREIENVYNLKEAEAELRDKLKKDLKSEMGKLQKSFLEEIDKKLDKGVNTFQVFLNLQSALLYGDDSAFKFLSDKDKAELDRMSRFCIGKLLEYHKDEILESITDESVQQCLYNNVREWVGDERVMSLTSRYVQTDVINNMIDLALENNPKYVLDYLNSKIENDLSKKMDKLKKINKWLEENKALVDQLDLED